MRKGRFASWPESDGWSLTPPHFPPLLSLWVLQKLKILKKRERERDRKRERKAMIFFSFAHDIKCSDFIIFLILTISKKLQAALIMIMPARMTSHFLCATLFLIGSGAGDIIQQPWTCPPL